MKYKAAKNFVPYSPVPAQLLRIIKAAQTADMRINFVAHSAGSYMLGNFLKAMPEVQLSSAVMWAPACSVEFYRSYIFEPLKSKRIRRMRQLNLVPYDEMHDFVSPKGLPIPIYHKSLLEMVSRGFDGKSKSNYEDLLGLARCYRSYSFHPKNHQILIPGPSLSKSHGGFDDDPATRRDAIQFMKS